MNHRILAASVSALIAAALISSAQEPTNVEPTDKPVKKHLKIVTDHVNPANTDQTIKIESGAISVEGGSKGTATITIDVNGKKETRVIDLGNATEIKIVSDGDKSPERVRRVTYLGVAPEDVPEELATQLGIDLGSGLLVRSVIPESPAAGAGLQKYDVLLKLDDQVLTAPQQLQKLVASRKAGEAVRISYVRRGERAEVDVKLAEHDEVASPKWDELLHGLNTKLYKDVPALRAPLDPLTFQKKIVIVDKEGNVLTKDDPSAAQSDALKRLTDEVERMRDQAAAAQQKAQEAIRHAEKAAREAAEMAKKEASAAVDRMQEQLRKVQKELERREIERKQAEPPAKGQ